MAENERQQAIYDDMVGADHQRAAAPLPEAAAPNVDVEEGRRLLAEAKGEWLVFEQIADGRYTLRQPLSSELLAATIWLRNNADALLSLASPPAEDRAVMAAVVDKLHDAIFYTDSGGDCADRIYEALEMLGCQPFDLPFVNPYAVPAPTHTDPEEGEP